jgi:cytochrome c oxidase cbb3-type subunit I
MVQTLTRAIIWLVVLLVAIMAVAAAADSGFAIHMAIVALAAFIGLWVSVSGTDYGAIASGILRTPADQGRYDDDPVRWGMIATVFWGGFTSPCSWPSRC